MVNKIYHISFFQKFFYDFISASLILSVLFFNIYLLLSLINNRTIVHVKAVAACQRTMRACGLLQALCDILMASGVPADVLTETINTVAEVIRGNASNQEFLAGVMAPSTPPRYTLDTCKACPFYVIHAYYSE